jgi:L-asparagine transporter-like permease
LIGSAAGLAVAVLTAIFYPDNAFVYLLGISLFGGLFAWLMIFVTHLFFRRARQGTFPVGSLVGLLAMLGILAATWFVEGMRVTLLAGLPWLAMVTIAYFVVKRR